LTIGVDVTSLAISARKAGFEVYSVDYFGDQDLKSVCCESCSIIKQKFGESCGQFTVNFDPNLLLKLTKTLLRKYDIRYSLLASGLDDFPHILSDLNDLVPILGNNPEVISKIRDRTVFFKEIKRLGIFHPETAVTQGYKEAKKKSRDIGYPVVIKPLISFAGSRIRKVFSHQEFDRVFKEISVSDDRFIIQEYVSGLPASVSIITTIKETVILTINEQILGMRSLGQKEQFGYCGNIVPLPVAKRVYDACNEVAEKIAIRFGLIGSNGIDLVITREGKPYVIEVNPRFQGSLECTERVLNKNIVEAHTNACLRGTVPQFVNRSLGFCVRIITFALKRSILPDLSKFKESRDIPLLGVVVEKGEPICSIIVEGTSRNDSLNKAKRINRLIHELLTPYNLDHYTKT
jgi:hypothetical protein